LVVVVSIDSDMSVDVEGAGGAMGYARISFLPSNAWNTLEIVRPIFENVRALGKKRDVVGCGGKNQVQNQPSRALKGNLPVARH
jgi:hypothetical protein